MGNQDKVAELILQKHQPHSRFRLEERKKKLVQLPERPLPEGVIAKATQVVEAGTDISGRVLLTELSPWPSPVWRNAGQGIPDCVLARREELCPVPPFGSDGLRGFLKKHPHKAPRWSSLALNP